MQAKLAAQKLSEGLKISMGSYTPDSGPMAAYREVHDEGAQLSSEEDWSWKAGAEETSLAPRETGFGPCNPGFSLQGQELLREEKESLHHVKT